LQTNRERFNLDTISGEEPLKRSGGRSNVNYIEHRLKDPIFRNFKGFTDSDDDFLESVKDILLLGTMAKRTARDIKKDLERTIEPLEMINILRKHIRATAIENSNAKKAFQKREVILSGYLIK